MTEKEKSTHLVRRSENSSIVWFHSTLGDRGYEDGNYYDGNAYLLFVTDTTDGVCVKKLPSVNFYRFNVKDWQFTL